VSENQQSVPAKSLPWWKYKYMWLVVGGPAIVVLASFFTLYLAVTRPDPVMDQNYYQKGLELNKTMGANLNSLAPAMQARNHAATGVPAPKPVDTP
jgi:hypothetical protein